MRLKQRGGALQRELEHRIKTGRCVYCRAPAAPDRPLTREHVIPRSKGGRRKDARIIVPACAHCNHRRGCQEIVLFLLARPRRLVAFLDYLSTLSPETIRELDIRVFAELYAAVWLLTESSGGEGGWKGELKRLSSGRRLHRRRYAARRIVMAAGVRIENDRARVSAPPGPPSSPLPATLGVEAGSRHATTTAHGLARLIGTLAVLWDVPAERVLRELERERRRATRAPRARARKGKDGVLSMDGWKQERGRRRRRGRVDARRGRAARRRAA